MLTKIKNRNQGFTIVETLIVLAIAGLIILIVLLAVPALQRTSRNTNIKSDASAIAGAINEYESNNGGTGPTFTDGSQSVGARGGGAAALVNGVLTVGATGNVTSTAKIQGSDKVYVNTAPTASWPTAGTAVGDTTLISGDILIYEGYTCDKNPSGSAYAVYYPIETSGGTGGIASPSANDCIDT